ncbi:calcineurin-binding protein cabin-1-like [Ostrinia furnacalis]|uniref:calcineurin-binding protein cabin-1-like n=1 Tax=Ostrinia furnacalis TaxID=93504 RepID=UPI001039FC40|nr:calcineurin-binding protein cabin-1-like [Ostrinia furnacalis]
MIKISALNDESEDESGSELEVTKEALEQIALQQYSKALDLQRKGNLKDATQLLKDLLDTELLYDVQKPAPGEKVSGPLFNLKYLCYKNLAAMMSSADDIEGAIEAFIAASDLDDTDITLWHRLGMLCMRGKRYEMALHAFQRGAERNPRHWPCLDKIVTLLLGLDFKEECISTIYDTLQLDPGYLRGLAYRKHIFTVYPYIRDFMEYLNPIYKWSEKDDEPIDEDKSKQLLKEAEEIHETFLEQQRAEQFKYVLPDLKLRKPIANLTWLSVGESLVHMHEYMTENCYSHACRIELLFEQETKEEPMEVVEEAKVQQEKSESEENIKPEESNTDANSTENKNTKSAPESKSAENVSESENNELSDKDKAATDTEKVESDVEMVPSELASDAAPEPKTTKKNPVRRRGSALSFLQQWEWCYKRRSGRKKVNRQDDENIYDILRSMVPVCLSPDIVQKRENQAQNETIETADLEKLFEEKESPEKNTEELYFGTESEQKDVKQFIDKYTESKKDIIDILKDYLSILSDKWKLLWPEGLSKTFISANKCYDNHIDVPSCTNDNHPELVHYANVNVLVEEFTVNEKLQSNSDDNNTHDLSVIETISIIINMKPHIFSSDNCLELVLRTLWVKHHIHILNKCEEFALDCMYQLAYEFEAMGEHHDTYNLNLINFTFKPMISEAEILDSIKFLERNKKLSTVMDLYDRGNYEEVLSIITDSFEHCKNMAKKQEEEMSLDFAVQLALILDTYWALNKVDCCFKWALICLHEALKHYFRYTTGSSEYDKWTTTVVKILYCMDHILTTEGLSCLETISPKELSQGLEDLIRVIGHQVETNAAEMPFGTVIPWIIMHYILQREEDQGRGRTPGDKDKIACDEVPNPLMVLFVAHEQLGGRGWCCNSEGKLLYFILDTVVPRLRSPLLAKSLEQVCQYMEQCVYCLYGHPGRKNKLKYLVDHNVTAHTLDWPRAQQIYEIFRPITMPLLEGKVTPITVDIEQLFLRILALLPSECDPQKYVPEIEKYIKGIEEKLPTIPPLLPYKMKDIYFLLGDFYFKKEDTKQSVKFNMLDVVVNNDRLESWAEISLAKSNNVERILNSCKNLNNERDFLNPAKCIIRCYKRALEIKPSHCNMWIEYGIFVYAVHSFCSRLLKQASESLSMENFESLEKQKEEMLDTTRKCFITVLGDLNNSTTDDDSWLPYYILGKEAEKRNKQPSVYMEYYMRGVKSLQEIGATYPLKINYSSPSRLCIEVLELHYRIHASILKYIEQHENKPIPISVGKVFTSCIEAWKKGPFSKKPKKDGVETDTESKPAEAVHAANILKRSVSDAGEEETHEAKRLKLESAAAKVRRSASYDTERLSQKETTVIASTEGATETNKSAEEVAPPSDTVIVNATKEDLPNASEVKPTEDATKESTEKAVEKKDSDTEKKGESSSSTSSSSSSDSSSSDTTSSSSTDSSSTTSSKSSNDAKFLTDEEIMKIVGACLDALEDCASRFPPHYKAIYRLAHYHFYYKKGKDIERCRDLMLSNFTSRAGQKLAGLFSEKKHSNFFNNIWKIPHTEVDRAGSFAFHMSRSVQLTMEILKEIDDHKTLLDLSVNLQRTPELDKKYLRDSDREELAQQAFLLCVQSLKGQVTKFSQQDDLRSNDVEKQALKSLTLDIYRAYQRVQKQANSKQLTNLLIEAYKLVCTTPITENMNLVDLSMKYCQALIQERKQQATQASLDKSQAQKKQAPKPAEVAKPAVIVTTNPPKVDPKPAVPASASGLPKISPHDISAAFQNYLPMLNDPVMSQQAAAALSLTYLSNALSGYGYQNTLQTTLQNSFQAEYYRQLMGLSSFGMPPQKKQKRGPKPGAPRAAAPSKAKSFAGSAAPPVAKVAPQVAKVAPQVAKAAPTPVITSLQKAASATLAPSMGTVLPTLPASMTANLSSFGASHSAHSSAPAHAHLPSSLTSTTLHSKPPLPHQQVSPGKTLQEKLAERQKHTKSSAQDITASISKLPSSLTITKMSVSKPPVVQGKKPEVKKSLSFTEPRPKQISTDEVIVLDDDD